MANNNYKEQVALLLSVMPEVYNEKCFALHGGTAINLFVRNMPRLSVDIDLTYLPIEDRKTSFRNINNALLRVKHNIELIVPNAKITHKPSDLKLIVSTNKALVKLEVNQMKRGVYAPTFDMELCQLAQNDYDTFCFMRIVPLGQLYGGKICAALDRQHPRDLFDIKFLLENEGFSEEIKKGFLFNLIGGERPIHELIWPKLKDQRSVMTNQFEGMSFESFDYDSFEQTRTNLITTIHKSLTDYDKAFLLSLIRLEPEWSKYSFEEYPAVKWKTMNLTALKKSNQEKFWSQHSALEQVFENF